jgi:pimeloyl-ACP methyl ester carboxylesterase
VNLGEEDRVNFVRRGRGAPVVLAHGLAASLHDWDDLLPVLEASGYAAFALDLLGHGASGRPADHLKYTVERVFGHFEAWVESLELDEPMVLIGHSLGGGLSLQYTLLHPQRVRALVLVNPFYDLKQLPPLLRTIFRRGWFHTRMIDRTPYRLFRLFVDLTSFKFVHGRNEAHVLPEHIRHQTALDYKRACSGIYNIPRTLHGLVPHLSSITQPALIVWGNRDQTLAPVSFAHLGSMLPNVRSMHSMPNCGHVPHQCHPGEFNRIVMDYLKECSPPP